MTRILGLVPARGGSKMLPGKNIRLFGGRPLISWTLDCARDSALLERIVVSTDSEAIAEASRAAGVAVPWLRPVELARDDSPREQAVFHCLDKLREEGYIPDAVMLLQPTSPLRRPVSIKAAVDLFESSGGESVVSLSPVKEHPLWCKKLLPDGTLVPFVNGVQVPSRRQDLPPAFILTGSLFLASLATLRETGGFYSKGTRGLVLPPDESVDIDDEADFLSAEALLAARARR